MAKSALNKLEAMIEVNMLCDMGEGEPCLRCDLLELVQQAKCETARAPEQGGEMREALEECAERCYAVVDNYFSRGAGLRTGLRAAILAQASAHGPVVSSRKTLSWDAIQAEAERLQAHNRDAILGAEKLAKAAGDDAEASVLRREWKAMGDGFDRWLVARRALLARESAEPAEERGPEVGDVVAYRLTSRRGEPQIAAEIYDGCAPVGLRMVVLMRSSEVEARLKESKQGD